MVEAPFRLFVAVPLPPEALESCRAVLDRVRSGPLGRDARWVRTENLHLTVRFLGDVEPSLAERLGSAVAATAASAAAFPVRLAGAGAFPDGRHPRTLWLGVAEGNDRLEALARRIDDGLEPLGFPRDERPRRPHLTIARTDATRGTTSRALGEALATATSGWEARFDADRVVLFRSHLGGGPPRYEPLVEAWLAG